MPRGESPNRVLWVLPLAFCLNACASSGAMELSTVRGELAKVQRDHSALAKRVEELEARGDGHVSVASEPIKITAAPEDKPLKVVKLEPKVNAPPPVAAEVTEDDEPRPMLKIGSGGIEPDDNPKLSKKITSKNPVLDPQAAKDYEAAYAFVKAKKPKVALEAFGAFIVRYPDHPYAANALFWRGECYYALGEHSSAIGQYDALVARYPASPKLADALLHLGISHKKVGSTEKARAAFAKLRKEFPTSEAAKKIPPEDAS
jgi:tol-pal system protein YbgF